MDDILKSGGKTENGGNVMLWIPVVIVAAAALFLIVVFVAANKIFDVAVNAKKTK